MATRRYFECLDTVNTDSLLTDQDRIRNTADLMLRIICGETLRVSQTQAFDSGQLLRYAENDSFHNLITEGIIEVVMREGVADPMHAFRNAAGGPPTGGPFTRSS